MNPGLPPGCSSVEKDVPHDEHFHFVRILLPLVRDHDLLLVYSVFHTDIDINYKEFAPPFDNACQTAYKGFGYMKNTEHRKDCIEWLPKLLEPREDLALQRVALGLQIAERRTNEKVDGTRAWRRRLWPGAPPVGRQS